MRNIIGCLFPWLKTFRRLQLEKRWWHRLAVVLFFVALTPAFVGSWVIGYSVSGPVYSFEQDIHHWGGPNGMLFDLDSIQPLDNNNNAPLVSPAPPPATVQKTIEMPNGKTATFPGSVSDEDIKAEWHHKLSMSEIQAIFYGFGIALLVTVFSSYLLQASYRAVLYIIYGAIAGRSVADASVDCEGQQ